MEMAVSCFHFSALFLRLRGSAVSRFQGYLTAET